MAMIDVVRFDGLKSRDWLIYKYPSDSLVFGAQLIVQEGQKAIFVKGGMIADVFSAGTYTLTTENLPILKKFVNIPFGGKTPFSAEVYFINITVNINVNWGTTDPIQLIDPKYKVKLRIRAFGQMGIRVSDPTKFFGELIGGMPKSDLVKFDAVKKYFRGMLVQKVKTSIANCIITEKLSVLEISTQLERISNDVKTEIAPGFNEYGLSVVNFFVQSVNFPDEDFATINKILESNAEFDIMGEQRYVTKRTFDVYEGAAKNNNGVAGFFATGGFGLGAGIGIGQSMGQTMGKVMNQNDSVECISCHAQIPQNVRFCPQCGANVQEKICECGNKLSPDVRFCSKCGKKVQ